MNIWTPDTRNSFIKEAIHSDNIKGNRDSYHYNIYPKSDGILQDDTDQRKSFITEAFAKTIYTKNPKYKYISLAFYYNLIEKIRTHAEIKDYLWKDIIVLIKGANAYAYLTKDTQLFPYSDLDIMIYINPKLDDETFEMIKSHLHIIALQNISQYKRLLDNMFFVNGSNKFKDSALYKEGKMFDDDLIEQFKKDYTDELDKYISNKKSIIISPFMNDLMRNTCSKYSFYIKNSISKSDSVVRIELPHFEKCENIPLKKTPFFCSYNETIDFKRDGQNLEGKFDLYRIRFNNLFVDFTDEGKVEKEEKIAADFIDLSISSKNDAELIDFWNSARFENIIDPDICDWKFYRNNSWVDVKCWMVMPNIASCINDLYKMLNVYECIESKKEKRKNRYEALKNLLTSNGNL